MDTKLLVYLYNIELLSYYKQWLYEIPKKMDASREHHPEWDNPVTKEQVWYAVTDNCILSLESTSETT